jgi:O-acetylhomoserine (thiol)-lyase
MDNTKRYKLDTLALHAGQEVDPTTFSRAVPIYQTTSYVQGYRPRGQFIGLKEFGNIYTRLMNPTTDVLEKRIAALEGGVGACAFSSGMAAVTAASRTSPRPVRMSSRPTRSTAVPATLFAHTLPKMGVEVTLVDPGDAANFAAAITDKTRLLYIETIGNPKNDVLDYRAIANVAHDHGVPLICDNTVASPYLFRPFEHGIDIVVHSCTKIIGGHGTSIGGVVVDSGKFPWDNGKFPGLTEPDPSYHGLKYYEALGEIAYIIKIRTQYSARHRRVPVAV